MEHEELLYGYSSVAITLTLFVVIVLFSELGFRLGHIVQARTATEIKALTGSIQASILGLLALLLGFTFNMSVQRYDHRSEALVDEANAIGTALARAQFLIPEYRIPAQQLLERYLGMRIQGGAMSLSSQAERAEYDKQVTAVHNELWSLAIEATTADPRAVTSGAFVTAVNSMVDAYGKRNAMLRLHVPEVVLLLLFTVFVASGAILGYSNGLTGGRIITAPVLVASLIALIVFIIIDLDRPRRGLIRVDQSSMIELQRSLAPRSAGYSGSLAPAAAPWLADSRSASSSTEYSK